ncbi:MAG: transcription termination/antitermination protein NusG [Candidatus Levybacteria bacterium]|nr:transcription termination/antitermination protein NusG [Candidatus Levybacteria bacterium]
MDTKDDLKQEEVAETPTDGELSLDDMLAATVPADTAVADEIQDSVEAPKEETEVIDPAPNEEVVETASEMIEDEAEEAEDALKEASDALKEKENVTPLPAPKEYRGKWYIVHTYSGHENKVAKTLMQRVQAMGFEERIFDALVPTRDTIRVRGGKKETIKEKIFPGYILVNMDLSDEAWVLVRTTPGVTSFVGAQNKPTPIRDDEVQAIVAFVGQKDPIYKAQFSTGEAVKITDGPFSDFLGTIESIDEAKGKVKVLVSIFGRETPVELDFLQVTKI